MIGSNYVELKLLKKSLLKKFSIFTTTIKTLGKQKTFENFLIKKFIYFNLHYNSTKHNKLFKFALWSNCPEGHHVLESWVKILLSGLKNYLMDIYFISGTNFPFHFSLCLNPAIHRMGNAPNILCPWCKKQE